mmetsp:Transcript_14132/g.27461  ORF Transcript_14132/g.27461 Transcript_14132/m.27461 type:complete len:223 (+) Transcript_14132:1003-1671(+)
MFTWMLMPTKKTLNPLKMFFVPRMFLLEPKNSPLTILTPEKQPGVKSNVRGREWLQAEAALWKKTKTKETKSTEQRICRLTRGKAKVDRKIWKEAQQGAAIDGVRAPNSLRQVQQTEGPLPQAKSPSSWPSPTSVNKLPPLLRGAPRRYKRPAKAVTLALTLSEARRGLLTIAKIATRVSIAIACPRRGWYLWRTYLRKMTKRKTRSTPQLVKGSVEGQAGG